MNKALVLAIFLGIVSAAGDKGWFYPNVDSTPDYFVDSDYFKLGYYLQVDAGYDTFY